MPIRQPQNLEKQILATIVYYDIFNYPLTAFEIFLYLINDNRKLGNWEIGNKKELSSEASELSSFLFLLENSEYLKKYISQKFGFYFLKSRENANGLRGPETGTMEPTYTPPGDIVQQRLDRKKLADQKWKKIRKIFWIMQIAPFVKMVLVSGSLALGNSRKESDADLIIMAKKGRIWTVRTFVTLLTSVLGVRRHKNKTKDKICLNHYITDKSLRIPFKSLYNAQSYVHIINVYDSEKDKKMFERFQKENRWIKEYAGNYEFSKLESFRSIKRSKALGLFSRFFEIILAGKTGDFFERKMSKIQSYKIKKDILYKKKGGRITISNDQLEFHPDSHEGYIIPEFNRRMEELGLFEFANQKDSGLE